MNSLTHMVPAMDPIRWMSGDLCSLQEGADNLGPLVGIYEVSTGNYDVLKELLGSDLEYEDFEE